jgi:hypothetical protein
MPGTGRAVMVGAEVDHMTDDRDDARRLSRDELFRLFDLALEVDSVELKMTVRDDERERALSVLGVDPLQAQIRQVFFFDTPDLALSRHGVVPRARRIQHEGADVVLKLRPVVPHELPAKLRAAAGLRVEVDALPGGYVCSAALKAESGHHQVKEVVAGKRRPHTLFTARQQALFAEHAPAGITLDDLSVLGPVNVLKLKFKPAGASRKLALELWSYPGDLRLLEISTKVAPKEIFDAGVEVAGFLRERGLSLSGPQTTKTRTALEIFSRRLTEPQPAGGPDVMAE